tara:strand:- start:55 stop:252 length:198 start_codon:yes stop_codon:yes gene_type:complete
MQLLHMESRQNNRKKEELEMTELMTNVHYFMQDHHLMIKFLFIVIGAAAFGFVINMDKRLKKDRL